jgi:hypothetical protein
MDKPSPGSWTRQPLPQTFEIGTEAIPMFRSWEGG